MLLNIGRTAFFAFMVWGLLCYHAGWDITGHVL